jgi:2-keto-4-pentenoate hydratase/2-oxohepta-3-ene-1,7-dioic acid hydratase in catechol pathway
MSPQLHHQHPFAATRMATLTFRNSTTTLAAGKLICIGRNYADHAKEMHADIPKEPVLFLKPASAIIPSGGTIVIPPFSHELHHEVELVALISRGGSRIPVSEAMSHIGGYAAGLDMTLRDVQAEAKKKGLPWTVAKGFDTSAPLSPFVEPESIPDPHNLTISLSVNGIRRQYSSTANMIFRLDFIVAYISSIFTLEPGDLIFTGTPEGVGPAEPGDILTAEIEKIGILTATVARGVPQPLV